MTKKQREVWILFTKGNTVSEIAQITGKSKGSVYALLKTIRARAGAPPVKTIEKKSVSCKNSPSCFTCPLKDCVLNESVIVRTNLLPGDMERDGHH